MPVAHWEAEHVLSTAPLLVGLMPGPHQTLAEMSSSTWVTVGGPPAIALVGVFAGLFIQGRLNRRLAREADAALRARDEAAAVRDGAWRFEEEIAPHVTKVLHAARRLQGQVVVSGTITTEEICALDEPIDFFESRGLTAVLGGHCNDLRHAAIGYKGAQETQVMLAEQMKASPSVDRGHQSADHSARVQAKADETRRAAEQVRATIRSLLRDLAVRQGHPLGDQPMS
jgi:hypothetical protein